MSVIGALRVIMGIDTASYESGLRRAQTKTVEANRGIVASFTQMKTVVAGIASGLLAGFFIQQARQAFEFAASLGETARSIGVTVEQLQILQRAAIENGASVEGMERAIAILNRTLGQARAGVPAAVQAFQALHIDPHAFSDAGAVLPRVMEAIRNLATQSEQAAAAQRLMGRGASEMIPFLVQGAAGYDRVAAAAHEAGLVTEEQANRADEASDKISLLAYSLRTNLAGALVDILPFIERVITGLAAIASTAAQAVAYINSIRLPGGGSNGPTLGNFIAAAFPAIPGFTQWNPGGDNSGQSGPLAGAFAAHPSTDTGNQNLHLGGGGHRGGNGDAARKKALRDQHEIDTEIRRSQIDQLQEQQQQARDWSERGDLQQSILDLENQQYASDVALKVALGDMSAADAQRVLAAHRALDEEKRHTIGLERMRTLQEEENDLSDQRYELAADALRDQSQLADTAAERRRIELELLDLTYRHQRAKLEEVINAERTNQHERNRAQQELTALDAGHADQVRGVLHGTMGPLEEFLSQLPTTAARANEALEAVAANGLQSLTDGIVDAITGAKSLADVFKNVAKSIIADLLRIQIQRSIIGPLSNMLNGLMPGSHGSFDFLSAASSIAPGAFAQGGEIRIGGMAGVDRNLLSINNRPVARVGMGETIGISNGRSGTGGSGIIINQTFAPSFAGNAPTREEMVFLAGQVKQDTIDVVRQIARRRG